MSFIRSAVLIAILFAAGTAQARNAYLSAFNTKYGTAGTRLDTCNTCHGSTTSTWNPYGTNVKAQITAGASIDAALATVEPLDSDGDTYSNLTEIKALTFPGDPNDKPSTVSYCPDADADGYAVCSGTCVLPTGKQCGDCNDSNAAVNPGATEGPFASATCSDAIDNNCNGLVDSADAGCAPPPSDYDIVGVSAPAAALVRQPITLSVTIVNAGTTDPGGMITITGTQGTKIISLASNQLFQAAPGATTTLSFSYTPKSTGTINWTVTVVDGNPDVDQATASTNVTRK